MAPPPCRKANAITSAAPASEAIQNSGRWPLMGDGDCDQRGGDRQDAEHHAAMRSVDRLHAERHQQRKQDADANHRDHELSPQRARRKRPAQHNKKHQRTQAGDCRAHRGQRDRINGGNRKPCRRQGAAENHHADKTQQQTEAFARGMRRTWREWLSGLPPAYSQSHSVHMAAMRALSRCNTAPHQSKAREKQQGEHDVVEIPLAQSPIDPRAEPRADQRTRKRHQREPEQLRSTKPLAICTQRAAPSTVPLKIWKTPRR